MRIAQTVAALVAVLFGLLTVFAGGRVLLGSDPGYTVFLPLLIFNTTMGAVYIVTGVLIWRSVKQGMNGAAAIFFLNLVVLAIIVYLYKEGSSIAVDSLRAMSFRTIVWFILFVVSLWLHRTSRKNS